MPSTLSVINHLLPAIITIGALVLFLVLRVGLPYVRHVALVANANDEDGIVRFAKYLASKTGGKRIHVDQFWSKFVPVAKELRQNHLNKRIDR